MGKMSLRSIESSSSSDEAEGVAYKHYRNINVVKSPESQQESSMLNISPTKEVYNSPVKGGKSPSVVPLKDSTGILNYPQAK